MHLGKLIGIVAVWAVASFGTVGVAQAVTCTTTNTNQVTCTGGAGANVAFATSGAAGTTTNQALGQLTAVR